MKHFNRHIGIPGTDRWLLREQELCMRQATPYSIDDAIKDN